MELGWVGVEMELGVELELDNIKSAYVHFGDPMESMH